MIGDPDNDDDNIGVAMTYNSSTSIINT